MNTCKKCSNEHDGTYGSGKYCSSKCAFNRSSQTKQLYIGLSDEDFQIRKNKRKEIARNAAIEKSRLRKIERLVALESGDWDSLFAKEQKTRVLLEQEYKCKVCNNSMEWCGLPLKFDLDHIDGNTKNNNRDNLRCLCPNCHSQTPTYKNKNASGKKYSDSEIIEALKNSDSVYHALKELGMNLHGGNYTRIRNIVKTYNLKLDYLLL